MHFSAIPWRHYTSLKMNNKRVLYGVAALALLALVARAVAVISATGTPHPLPPSPAVTPEVNAPKPAPVLGLFSEPTAGTELNVADIAVSDARLFNAPVSRLPFQVAGALSSSNPEKASAIIISGKTQLMVNVGEKLAGSQAEVIRVFPDRVIIAHQGVYESLRMAQDRPANSP